MKRSKLLFPVLGFVPLVGASVGTMIGCGCSTQTEYILAGEKDVSIVGNEIYNYLEFTLNQDLKSGQTLTTDAQDNEYFMFGAPVVENRLVKLPVVWIYEDNVPSTKLWKQNITFTCNNSNGSKAWSQKINNCSVSYSPNIVLTSTAEGYSEEISNNNKTLTGHFYFELGDQLEYILELKPYFTVHSGQDVYTIDNSKTEITTDGTTADLKLVINKNTDFATGDKFSFDVQIECTIKDTTLTYWQSTKFTNMSLSYNAVEKAVDVENFILEDDPDQTGAKMLTGFKAEAFDGKNTLLIPAKTNDLWIRKIGNGTNPLSLPNNITKIKIEGIGVQEFADNVFNGCTSVKYIDVSAITNEVKSLETLLQFGDDSFANWTQDGCVIYHKDLSQYKRHIVKEKLWKAGLNNTKWYGYTSVSSEEQLREAAYMGGNILLTDNIKIGKRTGAKRFTGQINFYTSSILDLNGFTIYPEEPIFNTDKAEFATIGVWDCELVVTDSNAMKAGKSWNNIGTVRAFDISDVHQTTNPDAQKPEQEGKEDNIYWEWSADKSGKMRYRTRENRCFYVRSDIPTRSKGTLEILTGNFIGNCTDIMNYNTTVYIEDGFVPADEMAGTTKYKGTWAPRFSLYSANCSLNEPHYYDKPCQEMLNCWESTTESGEATFQVWGGKFYSKDTKPKTGTSTAHFFKPNESEADRTPKYDENGKIKKNEKGELQYHDTANWCRENVWGDYEGWSEEAIKLCTYSFPEEKEEASTKYILAVPNFVIY